MSGEAIQFKRRYTGVASSKLDSQRRLLMPKNWRAQGQEGQNNKFYLIPGSDRTIKICDELYYNKYCDFIDRLDDSDPNTLVAKTIFGMLSCIVEPDSQGRFALSQEIITFANLGKTGDTLYLVGATEYGRILTEANFNAMMGDSVATLLKLDQDVNREKRSSQMKTQLTI